MPAQAHIPAPTGSYTSPYATPVTQGQRFSFPSVEERAQSSQQVSDAHSGIKSTSTARPHPSPLTPPVQTPQYNQYSVQPYEFLRELPRSSRYTPVGWYGPHPNHSVSTPRSQMPPPPIQHQKTSQYTVRHQPTTSQLPAQQGAHQHSIAISQTVWVQPTHPSPPTSPTEPGVVAGSFFPHLSHGVSNMAPATISPIMSAVTHTPSAGQEKRKQENDDGDQGEDTVKLKKTGSGGWNVILDG
jgi:hypothetical protein